ncbi:MAG: hypothetical protein AAFW81_12115, partial [Pseudomonadota bacterium]
MFSEFGKLERPLQIMWAFIAAVTAANLYSWLRYFQPAPFTDMVDLEWFLTGWSLGEDGLIPLIKYPDNEHRAFLPVLLQTLDHKLFASTGLFLIIVHIGCFAVLAASFARHAWLGAGGPAAGGQSRLAQASAGAMVLVMLWSAHWNNIIRTKQTHVCLALLFVAIAFWLAARLDASRSRGDGARVEDWPALLALSGMLIGAAWSFTAGLAAIPVMLGFAVARRWSWRATAVLLVASAVALGGYAWAVSGGPGGPEKTATGLFTFVLFFLNLSGGLFHHALAGDEIAAPIFAGLSLVAAAALLRYNFSNKARARVGLDAGQNRAASFFSLFILWSVVCAVAITASRAQFGPEQGFVTRYLAFGVCFVTATAMLGLVFRRLIPTNLRRFAVFVLGFYLVAIIAVTPRGWVVAADHNR